MDIKEVLMKENLGKKYRLIGDDKSGDYIYTVTRTILREESYCLRNRLGFNIEEGIELFFIINGKFEEV